MGRTPRHPLTAHQATARLRGPTQRWRLSLIETLVRDLRYAARISRRDAALTTFAILIIGVGVGASTIVFSVVNALWLRPLPFDDPGRLVWVANGSSENLSRQAVQVGHFVDLRQQSQSLVGLAGFRRSMASATSG